MSAHIILRSSSSCNRSSCFCSQCPAKISAVTRFSVRCKLGRNRRALSCRRSLGVKGPQKHGNSRCLADNPHCKQHLNSPGCSMRSHIRQLRRLKQHYCGPAPRKHCRWSQSSGDAHGFEHCLHFLHYDAVPVRFTCFEELKHLATSREFFLARHLDC